MKRLKVTDFGTKVQGVRLLGDKRNPEPESFRVAFPGGDVDIVRTTDDEYWIHIRVDKKYDPFDLTATTRLYGQLVDARLDIIGVHSHEVNVGDFANPNLYHLAVKVKQSD